MLDNTRIACLLDGHAHAVDVTYQRLDVAVVHKALERGTHHPSSILLEVRLKELQDAWIQSMLVLNCAHFG